MRTRGSGTARPEFLLEERAQGTKLTVTEWTVPEESDLEIGELPSVWIPAPHRRATA